jgi:hypothetical protein
VTADIERELRAVFEDASQSVTPRADLVARVRRATHRRRAAALAIAAAAAVLATGAGYLALAGAGRHVPGPVTGHHAIKLHGPLTITTPGGLDALAVGGPVLYVAAGDFPGAALSAYNRANGHLIRRIQVPSTPRGLAVGPGGSVWFTFYPDQNGGRDGVWLLSPDLSQRSSLSARLTSRLGLADDFLPAGATDALVAARGLADLHMPPPGRPGRATLRRVTAIPADGQAGGTVGYARLAGRVALLQTDAMRNYRIVFAGAGGPVFRPGAGVTINSMAATGGGLWITVSPPLTSASTGGLVRLNDQLDVVTPRSVRGSTALAFPDGVWATGNTVWVTTQSTSRSLFCFRFRNGAAGPVVNVPARLPPSDLAVTGATVYAADAFGVTSYRVPAACH